MPASKPLATLLRYALTGYLGFSFTYALIQLFRGMEPTLSWLGLLLAAGAPLFYLSAGLVRPGMLEGRPHPVVYAVSGLGLAICMTLSWRYGDAAGWVHIWAGLALVGWFGWVRMNSSE